MDQPQHKYDSYARFVLECKKYVNEIENYSGTDHLAPWYAYLLWLEQNFVIDFDKETIFEQILAACLCQFENDERYNQDRRLIKLFIKFIHFQEEQDMHYYAMVSNNVGSRVADLYINWAFYFDVNEQFPKADQIFRRGLEARAEPMDLLEAAHQEFRFSMSERMLRKNDPDFQRQIEIVMKKRLQQIASLRIYGSNVNIVKSKALQMFEKTELMGVCIPNCGKAERTPDKQQHNTSVAQNIIDSARTMRGDKRRRPSTKGCRLDFNENALVTSTSRPEPNQNVTGIKLPPNFKSKNLPQRQVPPTPYNDNEIGTYRRELPGYDKIMLVPATNVAFSADELKAYKWFKQRGIENTFTKEQDKIWGTGYDVPIRYANVFASKNFPQTEWIVPSIMPIGFEEYGPHRFMCNVNKLYPKNSTEVFSLDEVMWQKRRVTHVSQTHHDNKGIKKTSRMLNRTNSNDSKLSPIVEMELSGYGDVLIEVPQRSESIYLKANSKATVNKKRRSSVFPAFEALNDTCTTQMFTNLLHSTVISTPKVKIPRVDLDETAARTNLQEESKMKLFTDQSSDILSELNNHGDKNGKTQTNDIGFSIYEDQTIIMQAVKSGVCKATINDTIVGNKENILFNENQLVNLEPVKTSDKLESAVMTAQLNMKETKENIVAPQSNIFKFDVYLDNTETMVKVLQNAQKHFGVETTNENKENRIGPPKTNKSIEEEIAIVNKMIESVLNATEGFNENKLNATNYFNVTTNVKEQSVFKAPLPPKKPEPDKKSSDTFYELLDTTEEFEFIEAQCANSPNTANNTTVELPVIKLEESFAKAVTIGAMNKNKSNNKSVRLSTEITDEERAHIINNPAVCDLTRLNWTNHTLAAVPNEPTIMEDEELRLKVVNKFKEVADKEPEEKIDEDEDEDIGKSIYIKQPEPEFKEERDADWKEVTQFLASATTTNEYKVEEINLDETKQRIDTHLTKDLNPFDSEVQKDVLADIGFLDQLSGANNFNCVMMNIVQPLKPRSSIHINGQKYQIRKLIGTGAFGKVFSAECTKTNKMFALKQQRPPNLWEYYVCLQIHTRLTDERVRNGFMAVDFAVIGKNATIYASKFSKHGTILNVCNKIKQATNKNIEECIVMILVKQMLTIMDAFHKAKFIHADIKPDNFLLMDKLSLNYKNPDIVLQLIDFGQSIDLSYFSNHLFWAKVKTENFVCTEMMEDKPWTYHCDLFCLASTIYTMVAGKYMIVSRRKSTDPYKPQKLPRYVNGTLWGEIFDTLINIPSIKEMPSLSRLQILLDNELETMDRKKVTEAIINFNKALD